MKLSSILLIVGGLMNFSIGFYAFFELFIAAFNGSVQGIIPIQGFLFMLFLFLIGIAYILTPKLATKEITVAVLIVALFQSFSMIWIIAQTMNAALLYFFVAAFLPFIGSLLKINGRSY